MKLSNFKNALSSLARKPESELVISPSLTLHVSSIDVGNTEYVKRQSDFLRANPDHAAITDNKAFFDKLWQREFTRDHLVYLANVVITGWDLKDDKGNDQPFSPAECVELLELPHGVGYSIASAVQAHATTAGNYSVEWEQVVTKNS